MIGRKLRTYSDSESLAFTNLFISKEYEQDPLFEAIADKMYRHEYCLVGHELVDDVINWFSNCGLHVRVSDKSAIFTEIELV